MKQIRCIAHIRKNDAGEVRRYPFDESGEEDQDLPSTYLWEEGNYACDCNRELFFERSKGVEIDNEKCSHNRFAVNLENAETGEIYYREFEG